MCIFLAEKFMKGIFRTPTTKTKLSQRLHYYYHYCMYYCYYYYNWLQQKVLHANLWALLLLLFTFLVDVDLHRGDGLWWNGNTELSRHVRPRTAAANVFEGLRMLLSAQFIINTCKQVRIKKIKFITYLGRDVIFKFSKPVQKILHKLCVV